MVCGSRWTCQVPRGVGITCRTGALVMAPMMVGSPAVPIRNTPQLVRRSPAPGRIRGPSRDATEVPLRPRPGSAHDMAMLRSTHRIALGFAVTAIALSPTAALAKHGDDDGPGDDRGGRTE